MTKQDIKMRVAELQYEIKYEQNKMKYCGYGKSDLMYLYGLKEELEALENQLNEL